MRFHVLAFFAIGLMTSACASSGGTTPTADQHPGQTVDTAVSKTRGSGTDENVQRDVAANTEAGDPSVIQPPSKGGPQARGALCSLYVSNNTRYYVQLYISGSFIGTMGPWADYSTTVTEGNGSLYGKVPFDDGTYSWFGPNSYDCHGQSIRWTMHD